MRLLGVLVLVGCATDSTSSSTQDLRCTGLEGKVFASLTQGECGLGPTGPVPCTWHLTFSTNDAQSTAYAWQHSDYGVQGTVQCSSGSVTDNSGMTRGTYDAASQRLVWDSVTYAP